MATTRERVDRFINSIQEQREERCYEKALIEFVESTAIQEQEQCKAILKEIVGAPRNGREKDRRRINAFFTLANFYRRFCNVTKLEELLDDFKEDFSAEQPLYTHFRITALNLRGGRGNCKEALALATKIRKNYPHHAGVNHNYAETVAKCVLEGYVPVQDPHHGDEAMAAIESAIESEPDYPKFHRTLGILLFLNGEPDRGKRSLFTAMEYEYEKTDACDYAIRVGEHRLWLTALTARHDVDKLQEDAKRVREEIAKDRVRSLEFLGFFAALIALVIGSLQLTSKQFNESVALILVLGGVLLFSFGGLGLMVETSWKRRLFPIGVGTLLMLLSLGTYYFGRSVVGEGEVSGSAEEARGADATGPVQYGRAAPNARGGSR